MMPPKIIINHIGFTSHAQKKFIINATEATQFEIQDMTQVAKETLGEYENWKAVFQGKLKTYDGPMGKFKIGDFSEFILPGLYRIVLPQDQGHSYHFLMSDGAFSHLPRLLLDNIHQKRSGNFANAWRGPAHLDDAIRSDNGQQIDVTGGWYDAGDLRKWMTTANLPALGFLAIKDQLGWKWNHFAHEERNENDLITESLWATDFILKMQDPQTGMFYEEVGGGGASRKKPGMSWWYENHSGCLADNSQNHFTDNIPGSGDERQVRVAYNPIVQYISITILLQTLSHISIDDPEYGQKCKQAAWRGWQFTQQQSGSDPLHRWTSVKSWRLMAGLELHKAGLIPRDQLEEMVIPLLEKQSQEFGFWFMDDSGHEPYRGILHSAQPLIALSLFALYSPDHELSGKIKVALEACKNNYILPLSKTNPFSMMPYGLFNKQLTEKDTYREFDYDLKFRFFMPDNSSQRINHGLGGHWTSWAHGLALMGKILKDNDLTNLAWHQIYWMIGNNPLNTSSISGIGYNNPMPHSRFFGTMPGGFMVGARGSLTDEMVVDLEARAEWSSTEYWNVPTANTLLALSVLLSDHNSSNQ
ncbi:MAG: glycoside hydrolase family 9 protein [Candidatus Cyclobacteriaceae bacterium M3_2C_046]